MTVRPITPNLWFDTEALEAAQFYASIFPSSAVTEVSYYGDGGPRPAGMVITVEFHLAGQRFLALNGGRQFRFNEAISFVVEGRDQSDVDYYWENLVAGGEAGQRGWLEDRYGLSWQVVPAGLAEVLGDPDPERAQKAMQAMLSMSKLDIGVLRAAAG